MEFNSLNKIIIKKKEKLDLLKNKLKVEDLKEKIDKIDKFLDFKKKIYSNYSNGKFSIIAEIKQASPSAGNIIKDYDPVTIAEIYEKNREDIELIKIPVKMTVSAGYYIRMVAYDLYNRMNVPCHIFFYDCTTNAKGQA